MELTASVYLAGLYAWLVNTPGCCRRPMFIQWIKNKVLTCMQLYPQPHSVLVMDNTSIYYNEAFGLITIYRKFNAFVILLVLGLNIFLLTHLILIQLKLLFMTQSSGCVIINLKLNYGTTLATF